MASSHLKTGQLGESQAVLLLQQQGYQIIDQNVRSVRWGEIDIIALHQGDLVFIEVKTRHGQQYGSPIEAITPHKLRALARAAQYYKLQHPELPDALRIDALTILLGHNHEVLEHQLYQNIYQR